KTEEQRIGADSLNCSAYVETTPKAFASGRRAKVNGGNADYPPATPPGRQAFATTSLPRRCHCACQGEEWQDRGKHEKGERDQFTQEIGLFSVGISVGEETARAYPEWCRIFHG